MGTELFAAELVSQLIGDSPILSNRRPEPVAEDFRAILEDARSARRSQRPQLEEDPQATQVSPEEDSDQSDEQAAGPSDDAEPVTSVVAVVAKPVETIATSVVTPDVPRADEADMPQAQPAAPSDVFLDDSASREKPAARPAAVSGPQTIPAPHLATSSFVSPPSDAGESLDRVPAHPVPADQIVVESREQKTAGGAASSKSHAAMNAADDNAEHHSIARQQVAQRLSDKADHIQAPPTQLAEDRVAKAAKTDVHSLPQPAPPAQRETVHQRKVKAWIAQRREGEAPAEPPPPASNGPVVSKPTDGRPAVAARLQRLAEQLQASESLGAISARETTGDSAAASVARFLLSGASDSAGADHPAGQASSAGLTGARAQDARPVVSAPASSTARVAVDAAATALSAVFTSSVEGAEALDGAARVLNTSQGGGRFQVTMQLEPPELGLLRLQVRMHQHAMTLDVQADSRAVARLIESRLNDLRDALASHGIRMDRTEVVVRSQASGDSNLQNQQGGQSGQGDLGQRPAGEFADQSFDGRQSPGARDRHAADDNSMTRRDWEQNQTGAAWSGDRENFPDISATAELSLDLVA